MPIYEFFCQKCNTVFNFFSKSVDTEKIPNCPKCKKVKLERKMSVFANISKKTDEEGTDSPMPQFDEAKMESAMAMLASEAEKINEDDPRQAAMLMKKLSDATGLNMGPRMEEALSRMESGEDPETIEAEMGDILEDEDPFSFESKGKSARKRHSPKVDETLYDL